MSSSSGLEILIQLLFLAAYTMAAAGLFLPLFSRRNTGDRRVRASGRFLQMLAVTGIVPSLQVILDAFGIIDNLPKPWHPVINLVFNELVLVGIWGLVITWAAIARAFSPTPYFSDRMRRPIGISVTAVLAVNLLIQAIALISRNKGAQVAAQYGLIILFAVLVVIVVESAIRIYLPRNRASEKPGSLPLKLIPAVFILSIVLYAILPDPWKLLIPPMALITLFALAITVFMRQTAGSNDPGRARETLFDDAGMTPREREIALMLAEGLSYKEISARLFIAISTMQTHVSRIYGKMGVNSKTELSRKLGAVEG